MCNHYSMMSEHYSRKYESLAANPCHVNVKLLRTYNFLAWYYSYLWARKIYLARANKKGYKFSKSFAFKLINSLRLEVKDAKKALDKVR